MAVIYDLFPTILEAANVAHPPGHAFDGQSLLSLFEGHRDIARADRFLLHYPHAPHRTDYFTTLRISDWKVIYHYFPSAVSGDSHYQLFHLGDDPFEQKDLASQEPGELRRMMQAMVTELDRHGALYPVDPNLKSKLVPRVPD
jgi:arylsulfatase A-like enzyme